jgi:modulator of FtsH protease HflK
MTAPNGLGPAKNLSRPSDAEGENARVRALVRASVLALSADAGLILILYGLSCLTGSIVLLADALHSGGDLAVTSTVLLSILVNHRYLSRNWGRFAESLLCLGVAAIMGYGAWHLLSFVVQNPPERFVQARDPSQVIAFAGITAALVITFLMSRYKRSVGRRYDSALFEAEGLHTRSDFLTSLGVWCTILVGYFGLDIERWMTALIGLTILNMAVSLLFRTVAQLHVTWPAPLATAGRNLRHGLAGAYHRIPHRPRGILRQVLLPQWFARVGQRLKRAVLKVAGISAHVHALGFWGDDWVLRHGRLVLGGLAAIVLALYVGVGFYTIQPWQEGVELGLGRVMGVRGPGLHLHWPPPFGTAEIFDTGLVSRLELGFRTDPTVTEDEATANLWEALHTQERQRTRPEEALTLTGDENLVDSRLVCYYRIIDPVRFGLQARDPIAILRAVFVHDVHAAQRRFPLDGLLTSQRHMLQTSLEHAMRDRVDELDMGVEVLGVYLLEAHPPLPVVPQYRAVVSAKEAKNEIILRAHEYANELVPRSRGQAVAIVQAARADSLDRVTSTSSGAERFRLRQQAFGRDDVVHRIRLHWDAMEEALIGKTLTVLPAAAQRRIYLSPDTEDPRYE